MECAVDHNSIRYFLGIVFTQNFVSDEQIGLPKGPFILASLCIGRRRRTKVGIVSTRPTMSADAQQRYYERTFTVCE